MKNYKFVTMIQNIGDINTMPDTINTKEVFLTLINGFMYVQPGENTAKFYREFRRCLEEGRKAGEEFYTRRNGAIPFSKCVKMMTSMTLLNCIKENFDEGYFDSMLDTIECELETRRNKKRLCKLGFKQQQDLLELLESCSSLDQAFNDCSRVTSGDNFKQLMAKILHYTDIKTAYSYAYMLLDLNHSLNLNVFDSGNLEVTIGWECAA